MTYLSSPTRLDSLVLGQVEVSTVGSVCLACHKIRSSREMLSCMIDWLTPGLECAIFGCFHT